MGLEATLRELVADAVKEAVASAVSEHLGEIRVAHEPSRLLAEALAGGDSKELAELRRVNALAYLDAEDAGKLLGVGRHRIYQLVNCGHVRATRVGRRLIFSRRDIDEMMSRGEHIVTVPMRQSVKRELAGR